MSHLCVPRTAALLSLLPLVVGIAVGCGSGRSRADLASSIRCETSTDAESHPFGVAPTSTAASFVFHSDARLDAIFVVILAKKSDQGAVTQEARRFQGLLAAPVWSATHAGLVAVGFGPYMHRAPTLPTSSDRRAVQALIRHAETQTSNCLRS